MQNVNQNERGAISVAFFHVVTQLWLEQAASSVQNSCCDVGRLETFISNFSSTVLICDSNMSSAQRQRLPQLILLALSAATLFDYFQTYLLNWRIFVFVISMISLNLNVINFSWVLFFYSDSDDFLWLPQALDILQTDKTRTKKSNNESTVLCNILSSLSWIYD